MSGMLIGYRQFFTTQGFCQHGNSVFAAGYAKIDFSFTGNQCFGIRATAGETALAALRLRQQRINFVCQRVSFNSKAYRGIAQQQSEKTGKYTE